MYLGLAILCVAFVPGFFCYEDIHNFMSDEEVHQVFNTDASSVPEYEVVKLSLSERLRKRDLPTGSRLHVRAFGEDINLWLHPRDSILVGVSTPVYYARRSPSKPQGVEFVPRDGVMERLGVLYEDPRRSASLVIGEEVNGRPRVNGVIEANRLVVKSLPERVAHEYRRRRSAEDPEDSSYHVVYKTDEALDEAYSLPPINETRLRRNLAESGTPVPDTLYPEILVVLDHSMYTSFNRQGQHDLWGMMEYLLAFWNGVDLKYRSLESPRFRLNIAGFVLSMDSYATPYILKNMVSKTAFNPYAASDAAYKFFYAVNETFPFDSYDVAVTMTRLELGSGRYGTIWGLAAAGVCQIDHEAEAYKSGALIRDSGSFEGAHVVAHELGHVFGALHDDPSTNCTHKDGFIMAFTGVWTTNSSDFSSCSIKKFQTALDEGKYTCLYNVPRLSGAKLPKLMPGRVQDLAKQCEILGKGEPCQMEYADKSLCETIYCTEINGVCVQTTIPAFDGTTCEGTDKFCLHQRCVSLPTTTARPFRRG